MNNVVNGRQYTLWPQFVEKKAEYIGGRLIEVDNIAGKNETEILDIEFGPNGEDSAMFSVHGKDFTCQCDVQYMGVSGVGLHPKGITFVTRFGTIFCIVPKDVIVNDNGK